MGVGPAEYPTQILATLRKIIVGELPQTPEALNAVVLRLEAVGKPIATLFAEDEDDREIVTVGLEPTSRSRDVLRAVTVLIQKVEEQPSPGVGGKRKRTRRRKGRKARKTRGSRR